MANPLERGTARQHARHWPVGETRMIGKTDPIPVTRTAREYVYDLCDAYNAVRTRQDIEWFVHDGQLHLGTPLNASLETSKRIERDKEAERDRWKRKHFENQRRDEAA